MRLYTTWQKLISYIEPRDPYLVKMIEGGVTGGRKGYGLTTPIYLYDICLKLGPMNAAYLFQYANVRAVNLQRNIALAIIRSQLDAWNYFTQNSRFLPDLINLCQLKLDTTEDPAAGVRYDYCGDVIPGNPISVEDRIQEAVEKLQYINSGHLIYNEETSSWERDEQYYIKERLYGDPAPAMRMTHNMWVTNGGPWTGSYIASWESRYPNYGTIDHDYLDILDEQVNTYPTPLYTGSYMPVLIDSVLSTDPVYAESYDPDHYLRESYNFDQTLPTGGTNYAALLRREIDFSDATTPDQRVTFITRMVTAGVHLAAMFYTDGFNLQAFCQSMRSAVTAVASAKRAMKMVLFMRLQELSRTPWFPYDTHTGIPEVSAAEQAIVDAGNNAKVILRDIDFVKQFDSGNGVMSLTERQTMEKAVRQVVRSARIAKAQELYNQVKAEMDALLVLDSDKTLGDIMLPYLM